MAYISKYHVVKYILNTFPQNNENLEQQLIDISRIFGEKRELPDALIKCLYRTQSANHTLLSLLPQFTHTKIDNDASYHAWIARRDAGNALVVAKRKEKEAELKSRKEIKYEQYTIQQSHFTKEIVQNIVKKRDAELASILSHHDFA